KKAVISTLEPSRGMSAANPAGKSDGLKIRPTASRSRGIRCAHPAAWESSGVSQSKMDCMKILVVEVSGLHLGFVGCYGNDWVATPNLDRLAAEGIVFAQHLADCPDPTRPWPQRGAATATYHFPGAATLSQRPSASAGEEYPRWRSGADPMIRCESIPALV